MDKLRRLLWINVVARTFWLICFVVFGWRVSDFLIDSSFGFWPITFTILAFGLMSLEHLVLIIRGLKILSIEAPSNEN